MGSNTRHGVWENSIVKLLSQPELDISTLSLEETHARLRLIHDAGKLLSDVLEEHADRVAERKSTYYVVGDGEDGTVPQRSTNGDLEGALLSMLGISHQRETLWAHLATTSELPARRTRIDQLPVEILAQIFEYLGMPRLTSVDDIRRRQFHHGHWHSTNRKTIQNLRLVCRLFNTHSSCLLFPYLFLSIDERSLELARMIAETPHFAMGVRGIVVITTVCIERLAENFSLYRRAVYKVLRRALIELSVFSEKFRNSASRFAALCNSWDERGYLEKTLPVEEPWHDDDVFPEEEVLEIALQDEADHHAARDKFRKIFTQGYDDYRRRYEAQLRHIEQGTFVQTLAKYIGQMPHFQDIVFTDARCSARWSKRDTYLRSASRSSRALDNNSNLANFLSEPHSWFWPLNDNLSEYHSEWPLGLITQLPIAISQAGATLRHFQVDNLPVGSIRVPINEMRDETDDMYPEDACHSYMAPTEALNSTWKLLGNAFQHLQSAAMDGWNGEYLMRPRRRREAYIGNIITATTSNRHLRYFHLDISNWWQHIPPEVPDYGATIFASARWPSLERLSLSNLCISYEQLKQLFDGLGNNTLRSLSLFQVVLTTGTWAALIDVLRDKLCKPRHKDWTHLPGRKNVISVDAIKTKGSYGEEPGDEPDTKMTVHVNLFQNTEVSRPMDRPDRWVAESLVEFYLGGDSRVTMNPLRHKIVLDKLFPGKSPM